MEIPSHIIMQLTRFDGYTAYERLKISLRYIYNFPYSFDIYV